MIEHEVHADDDRDPDLRSLVRYTRQLTRVVLELRADISKLREANEHPPTWISRWVGSPRDVLVWVLVAAALMGGDVKGVVGLLTGWTAGRTPVVAPVSPSSTESDHASPLP